MTRTGRVRLGVVAVAITLVVVGVFGFWLSGHNQVADNIYDVSVVNPANTRRHPTVSTISIATQGTAGEPNWRIAISPACSRLSIRSRATA